MDGRCGSGAVVYLLACVLCLLIHTPMGSNIERYAVLLAGPLLLCALRSARGLGRARSPGPGRGGRSAAGAGVSVIWVGRGGPCARRLAVAGSEATQASYYAPVETLSAQPRREHAARGGAADPLALGGGAARAELLARAGLGEAAGGALRLGAAQSGADGELV